MWPKESECNTFYGNPLKPGFTDNLTTVTIPWMCVTSWSGERYQHIQVHKKCAESLTRVFAAIWEAAGHSQDVVNSWGMNKCGGGYALRSKRTGASLSMHAYGAAVDFDPARNALGDNSPHFAECPEVLKAFVDEGWEWGGSWRHKDGMHWQAART